MAMERLVQDEITRNKRLAGITERNHTFPLQQKKSAPTVGNTLPELPHFAVPVHPDYKLVRR